MTKTIRTNGKWAKVSGSRGKWAVAKGWAGSFAAVRVLTYPTKDGALIAAKGWVAD
jgi:hypothetical protein